MPARNALKPVLICIAAMVVAGPALAKYTEEWMNEQDLDRAPAAIHAPAKTLASHRQSVASTSDAVHNRRKSANTASPFDADPIAAFADDPIAQFARPGAKAVHIDSISK